MSLSAFRSAFMRDFACLGAECEDTCCKGWGMQVDAATKEKYQQRAPELLDALDSGEADIIMRRDPVTDHCVKFENGLCGIHACYGTEFLSDACHFYPRVTRQLGDETIMTGVMSCPEVVRLALFGAETAVLETMETDRLPYSLKQYLPAGMTEADARRVHETFLALAEDDAMPPERMLLRLCSVARSLELLPQGSWAAAAGFYLANADARLPAPQPREEDAVHLTHALCGLVAASKKSSRPRLDKTIADMQSALGISISFETLQITAAADGFAKSQALHRRWVNEWRSYFAPLLRRWLQAQLALMLFPFAGFGNSPAERATLLGVRFATVRLALMAACEVAGGIPPQAEIVRVVQSLSRLLDHLADPALSLSIYKETGWVQEPRMCGLIENI